MMLSSPLIKRFGLLSIVQIINFIFPFLTYLLLLQRLDISVVGEITSWQMVFLLLASLGNYNFPTILFPFAMKLHKKNVFIAFWNRILQIRFLFFILITSIVLIFYAYLTKIAIFSLMLFVGRIFNPTLFLSVMSKNKLLLIYNFSNRFLALVFIYLFVTTETFHWTNFIIGFSELLISIIILTQINWAIGFKFIKISRLFMFLKRERKAFYIQSLNTLIIMTTIPLTHLFFGAYTAGIISIIEKMIMVVRGISGNLFFSVLPDTLNLNQLKSTLSESTSKFRKLTYIIVVVSVVLILFFQKKIIQKFNDDIIYYLLIAIISFFPIILSTSYQVVSFKLKQLKQIYFISKVQLFTLVIGLLLLGKLFGIYGVIISIIIHEFVCYYLYKKIN